MKNTFKCFHEDFTIYPINRNFFIKEQKEFNMLSLIRHHDNIFFELTQIGMITEFL